MIILALHIELYLELFSLSWLSRTNASSVGIPRSMCIIVFTFMQWWSINFSTGRSMARHILFSFLFGYFFLGVTCVSYILLISDIVSFWYWYRLILCLCALCRVQVNASMSTKCGVQSVEWFLLWFFYVKRFVLLIFNFIFIIIYIITFFTILIVSVVVQLLFVWSIK